jgi:predicted nucleotidyltransferase
LKFQHPTPIHHLKLPKEKLFFKDRYRAASTDIKTTKIIEHQIETMSSQNKHRKAFEEFAEEAENQLGDSLKKLVLYGSVARNEQKEESDVDIFAVVENREQKNQLEELAFDISVKNHVFMVPLIDTEEEFEAKKDSLFSQEIDKKVRRTANILFQ